MRRIGFFIRLGIVVFLGLLLVNQPGTANVAWRGYVIQTSAAFLGVLLVLLAVSLFQVSRFWGWIKDGPRFWRLRQKLHRMEKGQGELAKGMAAIAAGNATEAGRLAIAARKLLGTTTATRLLQAQAAQLAGDIRAAKEIYRALAAESDSAVLGYRGLIMAAMRESDWAEVETLADKLAKANPKTPWLHLVRFEIEARRHHWDEAGAALSSAASARLVDQARARRHQSALFIAASDVQTHQGNPEKALHYAEKAVKHAPQWLPALLALAQKQLLANHVRTALRTLEKAYVRSPHPQLAALYEVACKASGPLDRHKQMTKFTRARLEHPASLLALAGTALAADLWGEARRHLTALLDTGKATQGAYRLLARLERVESGDERASLQWLTKAAEALPDSRWLCGTCGGGHDMWRANCKQCGAFNTLDWQTPGVGRSSASVGLIAGGQEIA